MIQKLNIKKILSSILIIGLLALGFFDFDLSLIKLTYGDAPYYLFNLITSKSFFLPHNRYSAAFIEYLPLIGIWLKCNYQTVFYLFGINFFISCVLVILFYYSQTKELVGSAILCLSMVYGMANSYYYYVPEHFHFFLSFFFVFYLNFLINAQSKYTIGFIGLILIVLNGSHLYSILLFFVGMIYLIIDNKKNREQLIYICLIFILGLFLSKLLFPLKSWEQQKVNVLSRNLIYLKSLDKAAYRYYVDINFNNFSYIFIPFLFLSVLSIYLKKYYIPFFLLIIYMTFYYINCLYFYTWDNNAYMNLYGRVSYLSILFAAYIIFQKKVYNYLPLLIFTLYIGIVSHREIDRFNKEYTQRFHYLEKLTLSKESNTKISVNFRYVNPQIFSLTWSTPFESLILSTYYSNSKSVWVNNLSDFKIKSLDTNYLYSDFDPIKINLLKPTYFHSIKKEPYSIIDYKIE